MGGALHCSQSHHYMPAGSPKFSVCAETSHWHDLKRGRQSVALEMNVL